MQALALISGGLDSLLAARIIKEQGIGILPVNFNMPFYQESLNKNTDEGLPKLVNDSLNENLSVFDIKEEYLNLILNSTYGFGSQMNPCIDCKILMLSKARELMLKLGAQFIITGEVLGQRPMSQHKRALSLIEEKSALKGFLLRPLSARLLDPTVPEDKGWVNRNKLLGLSGRSRKEQITLAKDFKIKDYPNASGGCLLTDPQYSRRLVDLISHEGLSLRSIRLLKFGRHFRIGRNLKLIVGRNEKENKFLEAATQDGDYLLMPEEDIAGPVSLGIGDFNKERLTFAASIACRYFDLTSKEAKVVFRRFPEKERVFINSSPLEDARIKELML
jgi:tRNA-uridine 2-sulfurtransferase